MLSEPGSPWQPFLRPMSLRSSAVGDGGESLGLGPAYLGRRDQYRPAGKGPFRSSPLPAEEAERHREEAQSTLFAWGRALQGLLYQ